MVALSAWEKRAVDLSGARQDLLTIFRGGLARVEGRAVVGDYLQRQPPQAGCSLIAIGKAAQSMAMGAIDILGRRVVDGLVISKAGHLDDDELHRNRLRGLVGGHPIPDEGSLRAGQMLLGYLSSLPPERPLLFLISGGTSSLVEVLTPGVTADDLRRVNQWLLASGLPIHEMNGVRRALSQIKGGGLLGAVGKRPVTLLLISDVPGDDPSVIGSGLLVPTVAPPDTIPGAAWPNWLQALVDGGVPKRMTPGCSPQIHIVANLAAAQEGAADTARSLGYPVRINRALIDSAAETAGHRLAMEMLDARPGVSIWGGEPTMRLPDNPGRGGRNQHLALAAAKVICGRDDICFLAAGTDGTDGPGEDAGAVVDGGTLGRGQRAGQDVSRALAGADSGSFLLSSGDLIRTGPTGTNVMDLFIGLRLGGNQSDG